MTLHIYLCTCARIAFNDDDADPERGDTSWLARGCSAAIEPSLHPYIPIETFVVAIPSATSLPAIVCLMTDCNIIRRIPSHKTS
ncbi:uncharacterized protein FMAN_14196 [Fusarium mangiferae]|uniref:Uncharacterized protein n=1 Tax=Fusarium mangiferae TaxID=192010 RepID=A0A1L7UBP9_FUSMA|nr:uncharacterized protein FMAN_14196 [Fusarium mangiferae]CVL08140.1 uncharacterized protein FMAN_14196 [Fusarium mangiferae]